MNAHCADLYPLLNLRDAPERRVPTYARVEGKTGILGNGFIELSIDSQLGSRSIGAITSKRTGETISVEFVPFDAEFECVSVSGSEMRSRRLEAREAPHHSALVYDIDFDWFHLELSYIIQRGDHHINKCLTIHNVQKAERLRRLTLFRQKVSQDLEILLHDGGMYFPVVFLRGKTGSGFFCMDSPGIFASIEDHGFSFTCYPGHILEPKHGFQSSLMHIGITSLTDRVSHHPFHDTGAALDEGERQWFREFLLRGSPLGNLPHVEVKAPALGLPGVSDTEAVEQGERLRATHVSLPRMQHDPDAYPLSENLMKRLRDKGIGAALRLRCNAPCDLRWVALNAKGASASEEHLNGCLACEPFRNAIVGYCEDVMEHHGYTSIEVSGAPVVACHATGHDHTPGMESLQHAFQGLAEIAEAIRENGGRVTCSGPYGSYGAGMARLFDSVSVMAPGHPLPLPDIHPARLFADMERLYFRRSRSFLLPKLKLTNTIGPVPESSAGNAYPGSGQYPWYLYHDSVGWRYAVISAIATGLRHRFESLAPNVPEEDWAFARHWLAWEEEHLDELREVEEILGTPGLDPVDGYSYTSGKGAIVFLFNTTYDPQEVRLQLHLEHDSDYVVRELYPSELNYLGPREGLYRRDSEIVLVLKPKEARVIEAVRRSPASAKRKRPEVFGARSDESGGSLRVFGRSGTHLRVGIRTASGFSTQEMYLPGRAEPTHILDWTCTERGFELGRLTLAKGGFHGRQCTREGAPECDVWLRSEVHIPEEWGGKVDTSAFALRKPVWAYPRRLFFVARFETERFFDAIRTSSEISGVPESVHSPLPMKYGMDLAPLNIGLRAWLNEVECEVYPAVAAWDGFAPDNRPVVGYFFEAGSRLQFNRLNQVVLFMRHFVPSAFRGICIEHLPEVTSSKAVEIS